MMTRSINTITRPVTLQAEVEEHSITFSNRIVVGVFAKNATTASAQRLLAERIRGRMEKMPATLIKLAMATRETRDMAPGLLLSALLEFGDIQLAVIDRTAGYCPSIPMKCANHVDSTPMKADILTIGRQFVNYNCSVDVTIVVGKSPEAIRGLRNLPGCFLHKFRPQHLFKDNVPELLNSDSYSAEEVVKALSIQF